MRAEQAKSLKVRVVPKKSPGSRVAPPLYIVTRVPRLLPHGGPRNRRDRQSQALTLQQCQRLISGAREAKAIALPLNRMVTVHLERAGVADTEAAGAIGRLLKLYREWLTKAPARSAKQARLSKASARRGGQAAALWVRENGPSKGSHVHILLHVPEGVNLGSRTRRWVELATSRSYKRGVVRTRTLPRGEAYGVNLNNVLTYMLKGASAETAATLNLPRQIPGGVVIGKRCGGTQNIWAAASHQSARTTFSKQMLRGY